MLSLQTCRKVRETPPCNATWSTRRFLIFPGTQNFPLCVWKPSLLMLNLQQQQHKGRNEESRDTQHDTRKPNTPRPVRNFATVSFPSALIPPTTLCPPPPAWKTIGCEDPCLPALLAGSASFSFFVVLPPQTRIIVTLGAHSAPNSHHDLTIHVPLQVALLCFPRCLP